VVSLFLVVKAGHQGVGGLGRGHGAEFEIQFGHIVSSVVMMVDSPIILRPLHTDPDKPPEYTAANPLDPER